VSYQLSRRCLTNRFHKWLLVSYQLSRRCLTNRFHKWLLVSYQLSRRCLANRFHKWLLVSYQLSRRCLANRFHKWLLVSYELSRRCLTLATNKLGGHTPNFSLTPKPCSRRAYSYYPVYNLKPLELRCNRHYTRQVLVCY